MGSSCFTAAYDTKWCVLFHLLPSEAVVLGHKTHRHWLWMAVSLAFVRQRFVCWAGQLCTCCMCACAGTSLSECCHAVHAVSSAAVVYAIYLASEHSYSRITGADVQWPDPASVAAMVAV
jgi:hypothetical protein